MLWRRAHGLVLFPPSEGPEGLDRSSESHPRSRPRSDDEEVRGAELAIGLTGASRDAQKFCGLLHGHRVRNSSHCVGLSTGALCIHMCRVALANLRKPQGTFGSNLLLQQM